MPATLVTIEVPALTESMVTRALVPVDMRVLLVERVSRTYIFPNSYETNENIQN